MLPHCCNVWWRGWLCWGVWHSGGRLVICVLSYWLYQRSADLYGRQCMSTRVFKCVITCEYWVWYVGDVLYAVCDVCVDGVVVWWWSCVLCACLYLWMWCVLHENDESHSLFLFNVCTNGGVMEYIWCFRCICAFCFLYCDGVLLRVMCEVFEFLDFASNAVYVNLQYLWFCRSIDCYLCGVLFGDVMLLFQSWVCVCESLVGCVLFLCKF